MKTLVIGDTHLKQKQILPRVDAAIAAYNAQRVVFLGDYCDDWGASDSFALESLHAFADWVAERRGRGFAVDVVLGNHDMRYLMEEDGPGTQWGIMEKVHEILDGLGIVMAAEANGYLLTHAGVTSSWADDNFDLAAWDAAHASAANAARLLNEMLADPTRWRDLDTCGAARGGFEVAGPLWADKRELAMDFLPGVNQIVGHTPVFTCERLKLWPRHSSGMRMWHASNGREGVRAGDDSVTPIVWACDTFSLTSMLAPIGDGSMLLVNDAGAVEVVDYATLGEGAWHDDAYVYYMTR